MRAGEKCKLACASQDKRLMAYILVHFFICFQSNKPEVVLTSAKGQMGMPLNGWPCLLNCKQDRSVREPMDAAGFAESFALVSKLQARIAFAVMKSTPGPMLVPGRLELGKAQCKHQPSRRMMQGFCFNGLALTVNSHMQSEAD